MSQLALALEDEKGRMVPLLAGNNEVKKDVIAILGWAVVVSTMKEIEDEAGGIRDAEEVH